MPETRPVLLSQQMVMHALFDPKFLQAMPEFTPLLPKLRAVEKAPLTQERGCASCKHKRITYNAYQDFLCILNTLEPGAVARLKQALNVPALMYNAREAGTNKIILKVV